MSEPFHRPSIAPLLWYNNPMAALDWLERAFGFETRLLVTGEDGSVVHSEAVFGDGLVMVVGPPRDKAFSPVAFAGRHSGSIHVQLTSGIDEHCARARAAGAEIHREPGDQAYGDRVYTCRDLEGHAWSFGQTLKVMNEDEVAAATGHKVSTRLETAG
jgi:uncharacterized glyoxalase superfamily protein PhnB